MNLMKIGLILSLALFACQKKNDDKKSSASKDGSVAATNADKTAQKNTPASKAGGAEGRILNSSKITYSLQGGKNELEIKSTNSNSCVLFDSKFNDGLYSLNLNFVDSDNSMEVVLKSNQSLLKEMFTFTVNNAEKKNATLDGLSNFQMGDGKLKLKVKTEEFTSEKCDVSAKPRLYKTDYDVPGYEIELICANVAQTAPKQDAQKATDGQIKITAYCAMAVQK